MVKIGLVGTGMLGEAVGLHLLESGHSLTAYRQPITGQNQRRQALRRTEPL